MQPLLITSLVALLIALIKIRSLKEGLTINISDRLYYQDRWNNLVNSERSLRHNYGVQTLTINKLQVDNALLVASLKKKHRRVPKL